MQSYYQRHRYGNMQIAGGTNYYTIRAVAQNTTTGRVSVSPSPVTVNIAATGTADLSARRFAGMAKDQGKTVDATGTLSDHKLTGTVTGYRHGTSVHIAATPKTGFRFREWLGLPEGADWQAVKNDSVLSFDARCDLSLTAVFEAVSTDYPRIPETPHEELPHVDVGDDVEKPFDEPTPTDTPPFSSGGGATSGGGDPATSQPRSLVSVIRKYWWVLAAVAVVWYCKRGEK